MNATQRLIEAAEAVVSRWDSPQWEWDKRGHTAGIVEGLRKAISAAKEEHEDQYCPRFRSAASGMWYTDHKAAGDIDIVEVDGVKFFPPSECEDEMADHKTCPPHTIYEAVGGGMICSGCEQRFVSAKEVQGKVLTDSGYRAAESADGEFLVWHESNKDEAVAAVFPTAHRERVIDLIVSPRPSARDWNGKVLTDEEAAEIAEREISPKAHMTFDDMMSCRHGFEMGLRYARDNGYLAPANGLTVDDVMLLANEHLFGLNTSTDDDVVCSVMGYDTFRKALEARAENRQNNLRTP